MSDKDQKNSADGNGAHDANADTPADKKPTSSVTPETTPKASEAPSENPQTQGPLLEGASEDVKERPPLSGGKLPSEEPSLIEKHVGTRRIDPAKPTKKTASNRSDDPDESGDLDYTSENINRVQEPLEKPYNSTIHEDAARKGIAYSLIGILAFVIVAIFFLLYCKKMTVSELKEFAVILGPIVTLVSAATGFYYGTKSSK
ncbi:hypothetical protein GBZ48_21530 [Azospirillum melinis]|uniref:Uncharacterized protein n=1 Tax=Azospirillum melinis TaxID=328839 RepID=A0ABX2KMJ5_9PROT|nr:hypothetical protein [Azospirillum melinis]MBP2309404.1 hypothetical protein [Azospirillum melinis]NUB01837.1 hypothetical protein [Azospirillum melinis]